MKDQRSRGTRLFSIFLALGLILLSTNTALADDFPCTGSLGPVTVDNLRVPQNATCTLNGTRIEGNIFVETNATLHAYNVHVDGNIQAEYAARVNVYPGSFVGGSIQIVQSGAADISGVQINSDLYFDDNTRFLNAADNVIGGNLQAFQNTGGVAINANTIDGNLQCKENYPAPTSAGNLVMGSMEDQCEYFSGSLPPPPPPPSGDDFICTTMLGAITVENLRVPQNAACTLNRTRVEGNIFIETNAALYALTVHVDGNVQAEYAARVNVYPGSFVGGSIQIVHSGAADIQGVHIIGDLYLDDNRMFLNAAYNNIGGNLQAFQNSGGVSIISNTIDGNLQCKQNFPPPTGGGNIVMGNMEDQCAGFAGAPPIVPASVPPLNPAIDLPLRSFLPILVR